MLGMGHDKGVKGRNKEKIKDTRTTRFEDRDNNRSLAIVPEMLVGIS
jgi:hypothetical protein